MSILPKGKQWVAHCGRRARLKNLRRLEQQGHMGSNGKTPLQFQAPAGTPIVGQPFTVIGVGIPMNMQLKCNCTADADRETLTIMGSQPVTCVLCGKKFNALFNPTNNQIQMQVELPKPEGVPS